MSLSVPLLTCTFSEELVYCCCSLFTCTVVLCAQLDVLMLVPSNSSPQTCTQPLPEGGGVVPPSAPQEKDSHWPAVARSANSGALPPRLVSVTTNLPVLLALSPMEPLPKSTHRNCSHSPTAVRKPVSSPALFGSADTYAPVSCTRSVM